MFNYAHSLGVREERMLLEEKARTTEENAKLTAKMLLSREDIQPDEVFIVSKNDHLEWAMDLFKRKDVPGNYFRRAKPLGCDVKREDSIKQMEEYLEKHPNNKMVQHRLNALRKGIQGID